MKLQFGLGLFVVFSMFAGSAGKVAADGTAQALPYMQSWSTTSQITADDDWTGVPGFIGYRGDGLTVATGADPQFVVGEGTPLIDVVANRTDPIAVPQGGVGEFELADPTLALQGSGTASAPYLLLALNTTGSSSVRVEYAVRDIDGAAEDAIQPVALQYRIGSTGDFTNVPEAFVTDATEGMSTATRVTQVSILLPVGAANQPRIELRWITTNAVGSDEWVGIDNISIADTTAPMGTGSAAPAAVAAGATTLLTVVATPGTGPTSTGMVVLCNLTAIGGGATQALYDDGSHGDASTGDNVFSFEASVDAATAAGTTTFICAIGDAQARNSLFMLTMTIDPACGDGRIEGAEQCDDDGTSGGDGCSATCTSEAGFDCTGAPSVCTDIDECTSAVSPDDCHTDATCSNAPAGSFSCTCHSGYSGDGRTGGTGCSDIDECTTANGGCDAMTTCTNTAGGRTCGSCPADWSGDGVTGCIPPVEPEEDAGSDPDEDAGMSEAGSGASGAGAGGASGAGAGGASGAGRGGSGGSAGSSNMPADAGSMPENDSGVDGGDASSAGDGSDCGCRTLGVSYTHTRAPFLLFGLALLLGLRRSRRKSR